MLGYAFSPVSGPSPTMGNSNKLEFSSNFAIYQIEGEALEEISSCALNIVWIHFRVLGNSFDRAIKLSKKGICR
jgi:hypothetical protein